MNRRHRLDEEFVDSLDEELELSLEDLSFDLAVDLSPEQHKARRNYFTHLFELQRDLESRKRWEDYYRQPVPEWMYVPEVY